jgi:thiamine transport system substrate-binding protein
MRWLLATGLVLAMAAGVSTQERPVLTVYTYDSFIAEWGPGPRIKGAFEEVCACRLDFVALEDGVALLTRLRLESAHSKADIVLGLDTSLTAEAAATGLFAAHELTLENLALPVAWDDPIFVPFDYGYFAVVYDRTALPDPPASLRELVEGDPMQKILIQDPRTSTPGLGLLLWVREVYGDEAPAAWRKLKRRILTVTKGWSEAYGLFTSGEAPMVLSYTTSPAYHIIAENETRFAAASFAEGHYLQVEVAGRLASSGQPELAARFLAFMLSPAFQSVIPTTNWMFPAVDPPEGLPPAFAELTVPAKALLIEPGEVAANRKRWIDEWLAAMSQ